MDDFCVPRYGVIVYPDTSSKTKKKKRNASRKELKEWLSSGNLYFYGRGDAKFFFSDVVLIKNIRNEYALLLRQNKILWALTDSGGNTIKASAYEDCRVVAADVPNIAEIKGLFSSYTRGIPFSYLVNIASSLFAVRSSNLYSFVFEKQKKPRKHRREKSVSTEKPNVKPAVRLIKKSSSNVLDLP